MIFILQSFYTKNFFHNSCKWKEHSWEEHEDTGCAGRQKEEGQTKKERDWEPNFSKKHHGTKSLIHLHRHCPWHILESSLILSFLLTRKSNVYMTNMLKWNINQGRQLEALSSLLSLNKYQNKIWQVHTSVR